MTPRIESREAREWFEGIRAAFNIAERRLDVAYERARGSGEDAEIKRVMDAYCKLLDLATEIQLDVRFILG